MSSIISIRKERRSAKGSVGKDSQRITASGDSQNNGLGSYEAHYVGSGPQKDCHVSTCAVGKVEGRKEGRLEGRAPIAESRFVPH